MAAMAASYWHSERPARTESKGTFTHSNLNASFLGNFIHQVNVETDQVTLIIRIFKGIEGGIRCDFVHYSAGFGASAIRRK